jgi:hypothetical protein
MSLTCAIGMPMADREASGTLCALMVCARPPALSSNSVSCARHDSKSSNTSWSRSLPDALPAQQNSRVHSAREHRLGRNSSRHTAASYVHMFTRNLALSKLRQVCGHAPFLHNAVSQCVHDTRCHEAGSSCKTLHTATCDAPFPPRFCTSHVLEGMRLM